ncbi:MAG: ABC transporter ATP-binding protein [Burkholderiales bacterium]|nr:ABC transporter ATP-binding protein [Burkholderiales bacterium]
MPEALSTRAVGVRFQGLAALDRVDLTLPRGEIVGLLGPNGAGKTTLVNVLSGFQRPDAGQVLLDDHSLERAGPESLARRGVARTFQSVRLFDRLTVTENAEMGALVHGGSRTRARAVARQAIAFTGLESVADRLAGSLPYALERRVGIARALAQHPRFLLLDEPAAGMHDAECLDLVALIRRIPDAFECGVLLIEHNMSVVMATCASLHVLASGRTLATGPVDHVRNDPAVIDAYLGAA